LWIDEQIERGNLTPQDTESHPLKDALSRAIGVSDSVQVDSGSMILKDGDTVLLATDGLTDLVSVEEIRDVAISYPFKRVVKTLIELANVRGGYDNITCVLARFKSKKFRWFLR
jgi:protein phosphatase